MLYCRAEQVTICGQVTAYGQANEQARGGLAVLRVIQKTAAQFRRNVVELVTAHSYSALYLSRFRSFVRTLLPENWYSPDST